MGNEPTKQADRVAPVVPQPARPGLLRICPSCGRWFSLRLAAKRSDARVGVVRTFRCCFCKTEKVFAERLPPGAL